MLTISTTLCLKSALRKFEKWTSKRLWLKFRTFRSFSWMCWKRKRTLKIKKTQKTWSKASSNQPTHCYCNWLKRIKKCWSFFSTLTPKNRGKHFFFFFFKQNLTLFFIFFYFSDSLIQPFIFCCYCCLFLKIDSKSRI